MPSGYAETVAEERHWWGERVDVQCRIGISYSCTQINVTDYRTASQPP